MSTWGKSQEPEVLHTDPSPSFTVMTGTHTLDLKERAVHFHLKGKTMRTVAETLSISRVGGVAKSQWVTGHTPLCIHSLVRAGVSIYFDEI